MTCLLSELKDKHGNVICPRITVQLIAEVCPSDNPSRLKAVIESIPTVPLETMGPFARGKTSSLPNRKLVYCDFSLLRVLIKEMLIISSLSQKVVLVIFLSVL